MCSTCWPIGPSLPNPDAADETDGPLGFLGACLPDSIAQYLPERWLVAVGIANEPTLEAEPDREALRERAADVLKDGLKVTQWGAYTLAVSYTLADPRTAARIVDGITSAYIEGKRDEKLSATVRASSWRAGRVEEVRE